MAGAARFDAERARNDFPGLAVRIHGYPLIYLDNAATSQRPGPVIEAISTFELTHAANVHRGVHTLSQEATAAYDEAREKVRAFINAGHASEIIFTSGTTASLNLVAGSFGRRFLEPDDEILLTEMEHHSNLVPWQLIAEQTGAVVRALPVDDHGELEPEAFSRLIGPRTRIVALAHVSNVLGTVNPVREIAELAHARGAVVVVDGAQAVPHLPVDVQQLGCDFYAASAHKMYGPTGVGFLYGRLDLLEKMPPWQGGGGMIERVAFEGTTFAPPPARFEAGTPPIAQAIGLGAAIDYFQTLAGESLARHEQELLSYATTQVGQLPGIRLIGTAKDRVSVLSFSVEGVHPHDVGTVLDARGVAVRAGHHCAQPLMRRFGVQGTVRASFGLYNLREEVDVLVEALGEVRKVFG
ncbi:MAG TPA: cysteine desulfurase [Gemmatimonadales bacterium]|nr:cysteine desulfurase [Gemmatimonadales bacterium]